MHLTQKKAEQMVAFCVSQLETIGVTAGKIKQVSLNTRRKNWNGSCTHHRIDGTHSIEIMTIPSSLRTEQEVMNTVMHEVIHTIEAGHGTGFQRMAQKVNRELGYNIQTRSQDSEETRQNRIASAKWHLVCECCGKLVARYERKPKSKANSYHRECGMKSLGKLKLIQNN